MRLVRSSTLKLSAILPFTCMLMVVVLLSSALHRAPAVPNTTQKAVQQCTPKPEPKKRIPIPPHSNNPNRKPPKKAVVEKDLDFRIEYALGIASLALLAGGWFYLQSSKIKIAETPNRKVCSQELTPPAALPCTYQGLQTVVNGEQKHILQAALFATHTQDITTPESRCKPPQQPEKTLDLLPNTSSISPKVDKRVTNEELQKTGSHPKSQKTNQTGQAQCPRKKTANKAKASLVQQKRKTGNKNTKKRQQTRYVRRRKHKPKLTGADILSGLMRINHCAGRFITVLNGLDQGLHRRPKKAAAIENGRTNVNHQGSNPSPRRSNSHKKQRAKTPHKILKGLTKKIEASAKKYMKKMDSVGLETGKGLGTASHFFPTRYPDITP